MKFKEPPSASRTRANPIHESIPVGGPLVLCLVALLSFSGFAPNATGNSMLIDTNSQLLLEVSGEKMMDTVRDLQSFGTRAFYLDSYSEVTQYLLARFSELGIEVQLDEFAAGTHQVANVVATLNGTSGSKERILVGAHYDSENVGAESYALGESLPAPGADDDASGVAAMIELARVLSGHETGRTVQFAAFAAEEYGYDQSGGLAGSRHFALAEKAKGTSYEATAMLDMIGYRGTSEDHVVAVVNDEDSSLVKSMRAGIHDHEVELDLDVVIDPIAGYSDHYSFWSAGYPSVLLLEADIHSTKYAINPYYHSANDTVESLSQEQMERVTQALLGGILGLIEPEGNDAWLMVAALSGTVTVASVASYICLKSKRVGRK